MPTMDVVEWLEKQRDDLATKKKTEEEKYTQATMSLTPRDDGSTKYLYDAAQEIKISRYRIALFTKVLADRGITVVPALAICPNTGKECFNASEFTTKTD